MAEDFEEFVRPIDVVSVQKNGRSDGSSPRGIRLYCTESAVSHGRDGARYSLQIFAPMRLASGSDGVDHAIATASLSLPDLVALRTAIDAAIAEVDATCPAEVPSGRIPPARTGEA